MKQNLNIEAEGSELILKNKAGDYVIIPKKYRKEVQNMLKEGCHSCIDKLVETLPVMDDYAQDGTIYPTDDKGNPTRKETFTQWAERIRKLAPNLDYTKDDGMYDYRGAYVANLEPEWVDHDEEFKINRPYYAVQKNGKWGAYHLPSRNPITGEILKSEKHPTFENSVQEDIKMGYETYRGVDGKIYSHDKSYLDKNRDKVKEYLEIYDSGTLSEVTIIGKAPKWLKYKRKGEIDYKKIDKNKD